MNEKIEMLRKFFDDKGITQDHLAIKLGVDKAYVNKLMTGKKPFGKHTARKWCDLFGLSYSWLLTGEGNMLVSEQDERAVPAWMYREILAERDEYMNRCNDLEKELADLTARLAKYEHFEKEAV